MLNILEKPLSAIMIYTVLGPTSITSKLIAAIMIAEEHYKYVKFRYKKYFGMMMGTMFLLTSTKLAMSTHIEPNNINEIIYLMSIDDRRMADQMTKLQSKMTYYKIQNLLFVAGVGFVSVFTTYLCPISHLVKCVVLPCQITGLLVNLYNRDLIMAIFRSRSILNNIVTKSTVLILMLLGFPINKNLSENMYCSIMLQESKNLTKKYNNKWSVLERREFGNVSKYDKEISSYWTSKGLQNRKGACCIVTAEDPVKETAMLQCIRLTDVFYLPFIKTITETWGVAKMDDDTHVKSLEKRILNIKNDPIGHNISDMYLIAKNYVLSLTHNDITQNELIHKALSTQGTAGQLSKGSMIEPLWKDSTEKFTAQMWKIIVDFTIEACFITNELPEEFVQYMTYRKQEALEKDETGEVKIPRLMNAPNLYARVVDSVVFGEMNEAIVNSRHYSLPKVGINIFTELRHIILNDSRYSYASIDFSNFDSSQTPSQLFTVCSSRIIYAIEHTNNYKQLSYLLLKYKRHAKRVVYSTCGITLLVLGQQASGDGTTSDDNSERAAIMAALVIIALGGKYINLSENTVSIIEAACQGDDIIFIYDNRLITPEQVREQIMSSAKKMGWVIKPNSFTAGVCKHDGSVYWLSHTINQRRIRNENDKTIPTLNVPLVSRDSTRFLAKWDIAATMENTMSTVNRSKLAGKMLSFIFAGIGNPPVVLSSILMLLLLRSAATTDMKHSFHWSGLTVTTLSEVKLNTLLYQQIKGKLKMVYDSIEVSDSERHIMNGMVSDFNASIRELEEKIGVGLQQYILVVHQNFWNVDNCLNWLVQNYKKMEKRGQISMIPDTFRWWSTETLTGESTKVPHDKEKKIKITGCTYDKEIYEDGESYEPIRVTCKKCTESLKIKDKNITYIEADLECAEYRYKNKTRETHSLGNTRQEASDVVV